MGSILTRRIGDTGLWMCLGLTACGGAASVPASAGKAAPSPCAAAEPPGAACDCPSARAADPKMEEPKPPERELRLVPLGSETGATLPAFDDNRQTIVSNVAYGGLGEVVEKYLVLACIPLGERARRLEIAVTDSDGRELAHFTPDFGFPAGGAYCRGGVFAFGGCGLVDVQAEVRGLEQPLLERYTFACGRGE